MKLSEIMGIIWWITCAAVFIMMLSAPIERTRTDQILKSIDVGIGMVFFALCAIYCAMPGDK